MGNDAMRIVVAFWECYINVMTSGCYNCSLIKAANCGIRSMGIDQNKCQSAS